jgi:ABC-type cobalamin/Fe3+-siderophores transport system ATPase subunit
MLELEGLTCGYATKLFEPFSAKLKKGRITFLLGKNGAGKTTLLRTLAGLSKPFSGTLHAKEKPIYLPGQVSVVDTLTGLDIFQIYGGGATESLPKELLSRPFATLSSGEQRRLLLGATLSHPAKTVLLDEPFNFLDWSHSLELLSRIEKLATQGKTFLIATHHLDWALRVESSETWAFVDNPEKNSQHLIEGETKSVLLSEAFQQAFEVRIQILKNPFDSSHVTAISKR